MSSILERPLTTIVAEDVMHAPVVTCDRSADLREVAVRMVRDRLHCVVVADEDGRIPGPVGHWAVISDLDLVAGVVSRARTLSAGSIAASPVVCIDHLEDLVGVAAALVEHGCSHALVTERGRPVGVISSLDVVGVLAADDGPTD